jgi:hypothetical protein
LLGFAKTVREPVLPEAGTNMPGEISVSGR